MGRRWWLWAIIGMALLACGPALGERAALERADRTVELVLDLERLRALSEQTGAPIPEILARWRELGVTALAAEDFEGARLAAEAGLRVAPRNLYVALLAGVYGWETGPVIFSGNQVGGYPNRLTSTAALMEALGAPLGLIEFANQNGAPQLARLLNYRAVRVHSITVEELARLSDRDAAARYARAARERNARALYIRPLVRGPVEAMLARNEAYLTGIVTRLEAAGLAPGPAQPKPVWSTRLVVPAAAALAAAAGAMLLLARLWTVPWWLAALGVLAAGGFVYGLGRMGYTVLSRQVAALAVALVFPAVAVVTATEAGDRRRAAAGLGLALLQFVGVTLAGAALVAASLGDTRFLLQLEQFRGVKLAHVAPLLIVALFWLADQYKGSWWQWLDAPVRIRHVLVGGVVLLLAYVYVGRTGNDLVAVLDVERALRLVLEDALEVRPRTKEFLLGYPALLVGFGLWTAGRRPVAWPFLVAGTIASISVINTFAHAHSPLMVSAVRSAYGFAAGLAVSVLAAAAVAVLRRTPPVQRWLATLGSRAWPPAGRAPQGSRASGPSRTPGTSRGPGA